ncbi:membrane protein implicated in regulation of membrane protease activity [Staphylococcus auricularis]|uniref:Permease n=1 Tax=Staphylococcus auricularis TaxID=29379 RepID=A0AAP8PQ49_9STAP|nr:hypothetical protein [Staphylococcus auricularis]MBM0867819.1 hypothetical protein [Staphylococcus auricularis]MCG7341993.1 hypothetical protein [Staphylococcus auricularis]MDC6326637.1 hypothetical protein [Staphylococcus auricularis]MDN4532514.1 hypothetical protein [Staphylococcus auricularis]PNZ68506.1 hypothetical protein CD158_03265 [Staphylococcus auricularis]
MTLFDLPNYVMYTMIGVVLLTLFCNLALQRWFTAAIVTFVVLGVAAFIIPNFENIPFRTLLGYAAFMAIISLIISFLMWYFTRNWRRKRRDKKLAKQLRKREQMQPPYHHQPQDHSFYDQMRHRRR